MINNIGQMIRHFRMNKGMSVQELANKANVAKTTIYRIEDGLMSPRIDTFFDIVQALDINDIAINEVMLHKIEKETTSKFSDFFPKDYDRSFKYIKITGKTNFMIGMCVRVCTNNIVAFSKGIYDDTIEGFISGIYDDHINVLFPSIQEIHTFKENEYSFVTKSPFINTDIYNLFAVFYKADDLKYMD